MDNVVMYYREQAILLEKYSAELFNIDLDTFKKEVSTIQDAVRTLTVGMDADTLNVRLQEIYRKLNLEFPWQSPKYESEDDFWKDRGTPWGFH